MVAQQNISKLSDDQIQKIMNLENELGVKLVAYDQAPFADLSNRQVGEVQTLEKSLGITILAYK